MDLNYSESTKTDNTVYDLLTALNAENEHDPLRIILMLYDGCMSYLKKAIAYAESGDVKNKNIYTNKAGDIIFELNKALNMAAGGEVAENLSALYIFMGRHLVDATQKNSTRGLHEVIKMLSGLREGWNHVAASASERAKKGMKITN